MSLAKLYAMVIIYIKYKNLKILRKGNNYNKVMEIILKKSHKKKNNGKKINIMEKEIIL